MSLMRILLTTFALFVAASAAARDVVVPARSGALAHALETAAPGDILRLGAGDHSGPISLDIPVHLIGKKGARVVGDGASTVITITADDVTVQGITVTGSGVSHERIDAGIKVIKGADRARVLGNRLENNLVGVDIHGGRDAHVRGNTIIGMRHHRMNDRGNGVYVWNAPGLVVEDNDIRYGRDGIFVNTSKKNIFRNNRFRDLRFAVHYMYTDASEVSGNVSTGNHIGYAIMYSTRVKAIGNASIGDRDHGIMMNYANRAVIEGNLVRRGGNKCLFMYNANKNRVSDNRFEGCPIGIHFTAGSERNTMTGNAFIGNRTQVKYVGSRWLEWSDGKRGNFWSDHAAFDLNADGVADSAYRPNDVMDHILWTQPAAKLLLGSPAVQLVRWWQSTFPALLPGGVVDSHPMMAPVDAPAKHKGGGS